MEALSTPASKHDPGGAQAGAAKSPLASKQTVGPNVKLTEEGELPGQRLVRKRFIRECANRDFSYFHLQDCEAKAMKFRRCIFQHCVFERCYFRNVIFEDCDFTGARFIDCNLRGGQLITCKLEYTSYRGTVLDRAQFASNLPLWENVKGEVARSLRINAQSLGDFESVNYFINVEMDSTLEHWRRALLQRESYYQQKYSGIGRLKALWKFTYYWLDRVLWGHGERPGRIARNILVVLGILALYLTCSTLTSVSASTFGQGLSTFVSSFRTSASLFLGVDPGAAQTVPWLVKMIAATCRYISVAVLLAVLTKRLSRR
jgi:hypothetical protein